MIEEVSATGRLRLAVVPSLGLEHAGPELQVLSLHEVPGQILEQSVVHRHLQDDSGEGEGDDDDEDEDDSC